MDMYKVRWTRLQAEIFRYLCIKAGVSVNQRGIARALGVSPTAVGNSIRELKKGNLVIETKLKLANIISWEIDRDNPYVMNLKRVENLKLVYESRIVHFLEEKFPGCTIVLFGSYARGDDTFDSDIDIAIIGTKGKGIALSRFERLLEKPISINFYNSWDIDKNLKNNLLNGIVLSGGVEL